MCNGKTFHCFGAAAANCSYLQYIKPLKTKQTNKQKKKKKLNGFANKLQASKGKSELK